MDSNNGMGIKTKFHEHLTRGIESKIHRHICKHGHKHIHKAIGYIHNIHHHRLHTGELVLIAFMSFFTFIFAGSTGLPNNTNFDYPLKKVSTLECRILYWDDMPENCKIDLPIIYGANYDKYQNAPGYKDIYTTLWGASYSDNWNGDVGAHAGVDIATARGTPLYSIGNGKIYFAGWNTAYGNVVKIKYLYKGEYIYVIYAHMDTIEIEQGQTVSKGQRIGTVGNSGNTFGVLGGYHLHFQIAKDAGGWPKYSYLNCLDLSKGHYKIIQEGLCREELLANEYDPVRLIEGNYSIPVLVDNKTGTNQIINDIVPANVVVSTSVNNVNIVNTGSVVNIADAQTTPNTVIETTNTVVDIPNTVSNTENTIDASVNNVVNVVVNQQIGKENLILDTSLLDQYSQHFWNQNEVWIETNLSGRDLKLGEEGLIIINVNKKNPTEKYNGILNIPFTMISTNTNVGLSLTNIRFINDGSVEIKVKGNNLGTSSVLINFGGKKIGKVSLNVVN